MGDDTDHLRKYIIIFIIGFVMGSLVTLSFISDVSADNNTKKVESVKKVKQPEPLKWTYPAGKNTPSKIGRNSTHIVVHDVRCSCGRGSWKKANKRVFENNVRFTHNGKPIPKSKSFHIALNPKRVAEGEFTVKNKGTRYHDLDLCMQCAKEKKRTNSYYMKRLK